MLHVFYVDMLHVFYVDMLHVFLHSRRLSCPESNSGCRILSKYLSINSRSKSC